MTSSKELTTSGDRLKRARLLAGIDTRREFESKYNISSNTLQGWEQGKNPLSLKGARRVIEALKWEGLICSVEWLMHGNGMPPRPYEMLNAGVDEQTQTSQVLANLNIREEENIYKETQLFKEQNINSIIISIIDDAMLPYYAIGDYAGGIRLFGSEVDQYIGCMCIIELENNIIIPRILQRGNREGIYTLSCTNPNTTTSPLNFYNTSIVCAAPILWHRKKLATLKQTAKSNTATQH